MSFGLSVGDFVTVSTLVQRIVSSLRTSSRAEYYELTLELHGLQQALHHLKHLNCSSRQDPALTSIKVAALVCQYPLEQFNNKLEKFNSLGTEKSNQKPKFGKWNVWRRKLQWGFCMEDEVARLRTYLMVHVGSLNMRLLTHGLSTAAMTEEHLRNGQPLLEANGELSDGVIDYNRHRIDTSALVARNNQSLLENLCSIITRELLPKVKSLTDLATKVWQSNLQIVSVIMKLQMKLEAIILDQFPEGLGRQKITAGQFELFNTRDSSQIISHSDDEVLTPGLSTTMTIIIGQYGFERLDLCPRAGCNSTNVQRIGNGDCNCLVCRAHFGRAPKQPQLPQTSAEFSSQALPNGFKRKRSAFEVPTIEKAVKYSKQTTTERKSFKNTRLQTMPFARSPTISNVRSQKKPLVESSQRDHQDFQMQLMILEQQKKKRLFMARQEQRVESISLTNVTRFSNKVPSENASNVFTDCSPSITSSQPTSCMSAPRWVGVPSECTVKSAVSAPLRVRVSRPSIKRRKLNFGPRKLSEQSLTSENRLPDFQQTFAEYL